MLNKIKWKILNYIEKLITKEKHREALALNLDFEKLILEDMDKRIESWRA